MRVLLVDDDAALRMLLRTTFEVFDVAVDEAEDAASARRLISGSAPDVVVLDVHMPGMDGLEFCRSLKTDPATDGIAVVMLSGSEGGTATAAEDAGADAAVRKPFSPLQLLAVVEQLVGSRYGIPFRSVRADDPQEPLERRGVELASVLRQGGDERELAPSLVLLALHRTAALRRTGQRSFRANA